MCSLFPTTYVTTLPFVCTFDSINVTLLKSLIDSKVWSGRVQCRKIISAEAEVSFEPTYMP